MKELQDQLEAPFPPEAMSKDSSRGFDLTSIKAQWVVERLNHVFGIFGWAFKPEYTREGNTIVCNGELTVVNSLKEYKNPGKSLEIIREEKHERKVIQIGTAEIRKNLGDAYKSAATDCLGKAASWLGIGNDVFKGQVNPNTLGKPTSKPQGNNPTSQGTKDPEKLKKAIWGKIAGLTDGFKDQNSLTDIYKELGLENGDAIKNSKDVAQLQSYIEYLKGQK